jgi:hypothetical protein
MSVIPGTYNLQDHYRGSSLSPLRIRLNFDITGATIISQIKQDTNTTPVHEWKTGVNITVVDASIGEFILNQVDVFDPEPCRYIYDLQVILASGQSETYLRGKLKVIQDITVPDP